jgi:hypothetical protein
VSLTGAETLLEVITAAGVAGNYKDDIKIVRATDLKEGKHEPEKVNLTKYFEERDLSVLVPVYDGDIVILNTPPIPGQNPLTEAMQAIYPLGFLLQMTRFFI